MDNLTSPPVQLLSGSWGLEQFLRFFSQTKTVASELDRTYASAPAECARKTIRMFKPDLQANVKHAQLPVAAQELLAAINTAVENILMGAHTHALSEERGEVIQVHLRRICKRRET